MKGRLRVHSVPSVILVVALFLSPAARAQRRLRANRKELILAITTSTQTIEFGYRANEINGNKNTYDTFENLGSGVRLFDYTLRNALARPPRISFSTT